MDIIKAIMARPLKTELFLRLSIQSQGKLSRNSNTINIFSLIGAVVWIRVQGPGRYGTDNSDIKRILFLIQIKQENLFHDRVIDPKLLIFIHGSSKQGLIINP